MSEIIYNNYYYIQYIQYILLFYFNALESV